VDADVGRAAIGECDTRTVLNSAKNAVIRSVRRRNTASELGASAFALG